MRETQMSLFPQRSVSQLVEEIEKLTLISEGYKTKEISRIRESSPATVRRHRHNICQKLSLHENNALILFAMQYKALLFPYLQQA